MPEPSDGATVATIAAEAYASKTITKDKTIETMLATAFLEGALWQAERAHADASARLVAHLEEVSNAR